MVLTSECSDIGILESESSGLTLNSHSAEQAHSHPHECSRPGTNVSGLAVAHTELLSLHIWSRHIIIISLKEALPQYAFLKIIQIWPFGCQVDVCEGHHGQLGGRVEPFGWSFPFQGAPPKGIKNHSWSPPEFTHTFQAATTCGLECGCKNDPKLVHFLRHPGMRCLMFLQ